MTNFLIKKASRQDFKQVIKWAENEGWNPGLGDLETFYQTDPNGFLVGILDNKIIASISVVKYNQTFGFLGFYITHRDYRGQGYGLKIWNKGIEYLHGAIIGLDGVLEQQENYIASGFKYFGRNVRYTGIPKLPKTPKAEYTTRPISKKDHTWIEKLDHSCFGYNRVNFLHSWINSQDCVRQTLAVFENSEPLGFGTIRKCKSGYKIGPLFSMHSDASQELFEALCTLTPDNSEVTLDVPQNNKKAVELAESYDLESAFETARMYHGTPPPINWQRVFGITTFELG